jgi:hypothetical protein
VPPYDRRYDDFIAPIEICASALTDDLLYNAFITFAASSAYAGIEGSIVDISMMHRTMEVETFTTGRGKNYFYFDAADDEEMRALFVGAIFTNVERYVVTDC